MKRFLFILGVFLLLAPAYADDKLALSGSLKTENSIRIEGMNGDLTKEKNTIELAGQYKLNADELVFFVKAKYWYDAAYDFRDKLDIAQHYMGHIQRSDWLRDCYLDYTRGPWFLRMGKQQVAWGQADGVTILDRVNPVDLSEYWLPDFVDLRIPLWMANINYSPKLNSNLQLLIIPDFEQSAAAPGFAPFAFRAQNEFEYYKARKTAAGGRVDTDIFYPGKKFENSTFGLQWSDRIGDLQYTFNYIHGYYYSARTQYLSGAPLTTGPSAGWPVYYGRVFKRWNMYGTSFNKTVTNPGPLQGFTFRGDFAYYNNEPTYYGTDTSSAGFNRWDNVFWLIGVDKYVVSNWLVSFQFAQYILQDAKPGTISSVTGEPYINLNAYTNGPADQVDNIFTLKISTDFMHERLKPEVLWSFTDDNQGKLSPKVTYEFKDNIFLTLGVHYFYGNEQDSNGQFRDQSQFYTQLKYTF